MVEMERVPKTKSRRLADCETHLFFLWDALRQYPHQPDRYKQIATELRVLVADHQPKQRLLLAMMKEYAFKYDVPPPGPPFHKQPIPMVGLRDDPVERKLTEELKQALGDPEALSKVLVKQAQLRRPVPFAEYVEKGLAAYIKPRDYSFSDLVRTIAQQEGSGHESTTVDKPIAQMRQITIGGDPSHIAALIKFSEDVLKVGWAFIAFVVKNHAYKPKYFGPVI